MADFHPRSTKFLLHTVTVGTSRGYSVRMLMEILKPVIAQLDIQKLLQELSWMRSQPEMR